MKQQLHWELILLIHKACDIKTRPILEEAFEVSSIRHPVRVPKKIRKHLRDRILTHIHDGRGASIGAPVCHLDGTKKGMFMNTVTFHHGDFWEKDPQGHWIPADYPERGPHFRRPSITQSFMFVPIEKDQGVNFDNGIILFFDISDIRHNPIVRYVVPNNPHPDASLATQPPVGSTLWRYETMRADPRPVKEASTVDTSPPVLHFYSIQNDFGLISSGRLYDDPEGFPALDPHWISPRAKYGYRAALDIREPHNHLGIVFYQERTEPLSGEGDDEKEKEEEEPEEIEEERGERTGRDGERSERQELTLIFEFNPAV